MAFIDFTNNSSPLTPAQIWARDTRVQSQTEWSDFFNFVKGKYDEIWGQKDTNPQDCVDKIAALGTGAQGAFALHAAAVNYLTSTLPFVAGNDALAATLATLVVPTGWAVEFQADGSAVVAMPQPQQA